MSQLELLVSTIREKYETARREAEFYARMLTELEVAGKGAAPAPTPVRAPRERKPPVQARLSATEAVARLLTGCRLGLPVSEILTYVSREYGHQPNSLRTTLYNMKKDRLVTQDEHGIYQLTKAERARREAANAAESASVSA